MGYFNYFIWYACVVQGPWVTTWNTLKYKDTICVYQTPKCHPYTACVIKITMFDRSKHFGIYTFWFYLMFSSEWSKHTVTYLEMFLNISTECSVIDLTYDIWIKNCHIQSNTINKNVGAVTTYPHVGSLTVCSSRLEKNTLGKENYVFVVLAWSRWSY